jgi:hypothetical protein
MSRVRQRLSYANVVASIALFVALGGGAYAAVGNPFVSRKGVVRMCVQSANRVPVVVSPSDACPAGSTRLSLNQKGQRGRRGPRGRQGKPGSTTPSSFIDAYMGLRETTVPPGGRFSFVSPTGAAGILISTGDISLEPDDATFTVAPGTWLVTVAVGPAGPVQLEVDGKATGPVEATCNGTSVCTFQRIVSLVNGGTIALVNPTSDAMQEQVGSGLTILRVA